MIGQKPQQGLACVLMDIENITDVYRLHETHTGLTVVRNMFQTTADYLRRHDLVVGEGCKKVFLAHDPPACLKSLVEEYEYEMVLSKYSGKDAADKELFDSFHEIFETVDPRYFSVFVIVSNDQIFDSIGYKLRSSPFAGVCVGLGRPTRRLSEPFDEALWLWWDNIGPRLVRRTAKSMGVSA